VGRVRLGKEECRKMSSISKVKEDRECFDSKEITSDLGKLWPFGMRGAEVALEKGQERAEPGEMGELGHKNRGEGRMFALRQEWIMR
jgi:hypothetical protein